MHDFPNEQSFGGNCRIVGAFIGKSELMLTFQKDGLAHHV